jgi:hypothetical protein
LIASRIVVPPEVTFPLWPCHLIVHPPHWFPMCLRSCRKHGSGEFAWISAASYVRFLKERATFEPLLWPPPGAQMNRRSCAISCPLIGTCFCPSILTGPEHTMEILINSTQTKAFGIWDFMRASYLEGTNNSKELLLISEPWPGSSHIPINCARLYFIRHW